MAALDFPASPSIGQTYTSGSLSWQWDGTSWRSVATVSYLPLTGGALSGNLGIGDVASANARLRVVGSGLSSEVARIEGGSSLDAQHIINQTDDPTVSTARAQLSLRKNNIIGAAISIDGSASSRGIVYYDAYSATGSHAFYVNSVDRFRVNSVGAVSFTGSYGTAGQFLKSGGSTSNPTWGSLSASDIPALTLENLPDAWVKRSVRVATSGNITLSGTQTIDGIAVVAGDRVLVKDQTAAAENGIYVVAAGAWSRSADANSASKLSGATVAVDSGTANGGLTFDTDFKTTDTLGTTAINWSRVVDTGLASSTTPSAAGTAAVGTSVTYARADHVHPVDTSRAPAAGSTSITTLGTVGTGTWQASVINSTYGGTGVNNGGRTLAVNTNSGTLAFSLASTTLTVANNASVSGTNTGDQTITLTGDVTGTGTGSFATTLAASGVTAGTYTKVTVDAKGRVTTGASLASSDVTTALGYTPYNAGANTVLTSANYTTYSPALTGTGASGTWSISVTGSSRSVLFLDSRSVDDQPQGKVGYALSLDFKNNTSVSSPPVTASGTYSHIITTAGWDTSGGSGGWPSQLSIGDGIAVRQATSATAWGAWRTVLHSGNVRTVNGNSLLGSGDISVGVTSIVAGTGLSGGTITTTGTIALANTTVTAGSYTLANITVDAQGRITAASNGSAGASYIGPRGQVFTASGTFTIPTGITAVRVTVIGGGGTGGTAASGGTSTPSASGGGGGGGTAISYLTGLTPGATIAVTVGAAASASSIASGTQAITTVTASGGANGALASNGASSGGAGGAASGGTLNISGGDGGAGAAQAATTFPVRAGIGGGTTLAPATSIATATSTSNGSAGRGYGGGGSGAVSNSGTTTGGAGAAGVVIFEW